MAAVSSLAFTLLLWGSILGVALIFVYQAHAVAAEYGWLA